MSTRPALLVRLLVPCVLLATACAEPPTKEMNQAQGAIDAAKAAGAAEYAAKELEAAATALSRSRQAVDDRDYRQALNFALDARDRAQVAARQAADEKARLRTEADRTLRVADADLEQLRQRIQTATAAKMPASTLAPFQRIETAATKTMESDRAAFEHGDYASVIRSSMALRKQLETSRSEIDAAAAAKPVRRPARRGR